MLSANTIWIAFGLYMCFLIGVAVYVTLKERRQKNKGSLLTASVPWPVLVMTYIASLMSTWVFFAGPGAYYRGGLGYWLSEMSYIALFPIIAHFTMNKVWIVNQEKGGTLVTPQISTMSASRATPCAPSWASSSWSPPYPMSPPPWWPSPRRPSMPLTAPSTTAWLLLSSA